MDPEDLVQSAFRSFFRVQAGQVPSMLDWDNLWSLLTTITLRKCGYQVRHFLTAKRNIDKEVAPPEDPGSSWEGIAREPTPAEAAAFSDIVEHWLGGLDETERQIAELHLQGHSPGEISKQLDFAERTIKRKLNRIRDRLKAVLEEGTS